MQVNIKDTLEWLNTPYQHQGRLKHIGVDCIGLIMGVAHELNILNKHGEQLRDVKGYGRVPKPSFLVEQLDAQLNRTNSPKPGDIVLFRIKRYPQHLGILLEDGFIHAYSEVGKVVESRWDDYWRERVIHYYELCR